MAIIYIKGDMFDDQSEAIVNTVNCVGVMGKGVAKEFKRRWPDNFKMYKKLCDAKELSPGMMYIHDNSGMFAKGPRFLINFPTKQHWRAKSKIEYIIDGLDSFVKQVRALGIKSVALPPLGCGNGGLPWDKVRQLIEEKCAALPDVKFHVYTPREHEMNPEHTTVPATMTLGRAVLVKSIDQFEDYFGGSLTRICVQKITYFLKVLGIDYPFEFARNRHGPYSEQLKSALKAMNSQNYIVGYDKDEPESQASAAALPMADEELLKPENKFALEIIKKISLLIEGYENPYGMELLASIHYLAKHENVAGDDAMIVAVKNWNDHKNNNFSDNDIAAAYNRLREDQLLHGNN